VANLQFLVESSEVRVHVDVFQEVLKVKPQEQSFPIRLRNFDLWFIVFDMGLLVVVDELDDPVFSLAHSLFGNFQCNLGNLA
jgi:hypothetical protein